jgi:hypothetical protein
MVQDGEREREGQGDRKEGIQQSLHTKQRTAARKVPKYKIS